jgi:DNA gyrase subunit A
MERPNLTHTTPDVIAYIEYLEMQLLQKPAKGEPVAAASEPSEPPTSINIITISQSGVAKRTPRHFYSRQHRAGMGVFDLDTPEEDPPAFLVAADITDRLLLFTNFGRVFPTSVSQVKETEVRGKGESILTGLRLMNNERLVAVLPGAGGEDVLLASQRGWVRAIRKSFLGTQLIPGMSFHEPKEGGELRAACWASGGDVLIATRQGKGVRFNQRQIPGRNGCLGARVDQGDEVVAVASVTEESGVFMVGHDGKGTIRQMSGLMANKAPGAGAKVLIKVEELVGAAAVNPNQDIFIISKLGKLIRFPAEEIPAKEGVVQGVHCMTLRADVAAACTVSEFVTE